MLRRARTTATLLLGWILGIAGRWILRPPPALDFPELWRNAPEWLAAFGSLLAPADTALLGDRADLPVGRGAAVVVLVAIAAWRLRARVRVVALGVLVVGLFLAPAVAVPGTLVLGSRLYLPACGALVVIAEIVRAAGPERRARVAFAGATLIALALFTWGEEGAYRDRRSFARSAVAAAPRSGLAHLCLGDSLHLDGDDARALAEYEIALGLGVAYVVHNNIAVIHMANARWMDAERELRAEIAADPRSAPAHRNLAAVLRREGRLDEAATEERAGAR